MVSASYPMLLNIPFGNYFITLTAQNRRLAKDFEATIDSARAFLYAASVMLLVRRIVRAS